MQPNGQHLSDIQKNTCTIFLSSTSRAKVFFIQSFIHGRFGLHVVSSPFRASKIFVWRWSYSKAKHELHVGSVQLRKSSLEGKFRFDKWLWIRKFSQEREPCTPTSHFAHGLSKSHPFHIQSFRVEVPVGHRPSSWPGRLYGVGGKSSMQRLQRADDAIASSEKPLVPVGLHNCSRLPRSGPPSSERWPCWEIVDTPSPQPTSSENFLHEGRGKSGPCGTHCDSVRWLRWSIVPSCISWRKLNSRWLESRGYSLNQTMPKKPLPMLGYEIIIKTSLNNDPRYKSQSSFCNCSFSRSVNSLYTVSTSIQLDMAKEMSWNKAMSKLSKLLPKMAPQMNVCICRPQEQTDQFQLTCTE